MFLSICIIKLHIMIKLTNLVEAELVRRIGFKPPSKYNIGASLKKSWDEYYNSEGEGALTSYASKISNSPASEDIKKSAGDYLTSISSKAKDFDTLLYDCNFDDKSDLAQTLNDKISGDTNEGEEDTLRFYDFNIDASLESGMFENVVGLLDQLDNLFDVLIGMLKDQTVCPTEKDPSKRFGFSVTENKKETLNERIDRLLQECGIPGITCRVKRYVKRKASSVARSFGFAEKKYKK